MADLSVLIAARCEEFLERTIACVLAKARAEVEIICVLDGNWADPPVADHPRVRLVYRPVAIGQRAAVNLAARLSQAPYVLKLDAHCDLAEGFDLALIEADRELARPDLTQIPAQINLHAFNWRCRQCGRETYQGPDPVVCAVDEARDRELAMMPPACGSARGFDRVIVWEPRRRKAKGNGSNGDGRLARTEFWRFDHELHFQYHGPCRAGQEKTDLADVMSSVGACFFMRRARFWELGGMDERHGSWGSMGVEIACKSWLSGGRQIVNRRTYFSHLFRTQGAGFTFPYPISGSDQKRAQQYAQNIWLNNAWEGQTKPLSWLLDYFKPVRGWHDAEGRAQLAAAHEAGQRFLSSRAAA